MIPGSLTIVGTGITMIAQMTTQAKGHITHADRFFFLVTHPLAEEWMRQLNPQAESLARFYTPQRDRHEVYRDMADHVLDAVRTGNRVCAAFYGHPTIFVTPTQDMVRRARAEDYPVTVLPGISAEDCLFADLCIDPGQQGCQSYEASDFLLRPRQFDPSTPLVLWQVGVIGHFQVVDASLSSAKGLAILATTLRRWYPAQHEVILYEAPMLPTDEPTITRMALEHLPSASLTPFATLYVPPIGPPAVDPEMRALLGLPWTWQ